LVLLTYLLLSGLTTGSLYALIALGIVVVNKATGVINFAHGELFMFCGFVAWMLHVQMGVPYLPSLLLAVAFGFLLGVMTDLIAFRPLKNANIISLVLATIGVAFVLRGTARVIWGGKGDYLPFPPITSPEPAMIGEITLLYPDMGFAFFIKGFAAAVLGGLTSLPGAVLGGIAIGIIEALAGGYLHSSFIEVSAFIVIMFVLVVRPTGLLGATGLRRV
jgi:branched-subunit amino acid ABC-type transport system permease component